MKQYLAHLFNRSGCLLKTHTVTAFSYAQALHSAHGIVGTAETLADRNQELWVVPA